MVSFVEMKSLKDGFNNSFVVMEFYGNLVKTKILDKLSAAFDYKNFSAAIVQPSKTKKSITRLF
jgi:hypothetical protein